MSFISIIFKKENKKQIKIFKGDKNDRESPELEKDVPDVMKSDESIMESFFENLSKKLDR